MLEEQLLDPARHDRETFTCGVSVLDEYLHRFAVQQSNKGVTVVRVLIDTDMPRDILGYYSLSAAQIDVAQIEPRVRRKLPRYPVPCFRMGRLATHTAHHGCGFGRSFFGPDRRRAQEGRAVANDGLAPIKQSAEDDACRWLQQ